VLCDFLDDGLLLACLTSAKMALGVSKLKPACAELLRVRLSVSRSGSLHDFLLRCFLVHIEARFVAFE
jgi:hypothetical protein